MFKATFFYNILLLFFSIVLVTGCSKTKKEEEVAIGEAVDLIFDVAGVDSDITMPNTKSSAANTNFVLLPTNDQEDQETFVKDDLIFNVRSDQSADQSGFEDLLKPGTKSVPMVNGIRYRLMVYTQANALVASIEVTAGQAQHITVTSGQTYKWFAYSYNTSTAIPAPNTTNPVLTTPTTTPLLYASGQVTPTAVGTTLPITFKHQLTQLRMEIKESSGFRAILSATGEFGVNDYVQTGTFDILAGTIGTLTSANVSTVNFTTEVGASGTKQVMHYYTANHGINYYTVKVNSLKVQYTSTTQRTLNSDSFPNDGYTGEFGFGPTPINKKGYVLKGTLDITFALPNMRILPFSNNNASNGYRLAPATAAGAFLREPANFGPTSKYVGIKSLTIDPPTTATEATSSSTGWNRFKALMTNPATYPDVLIVANWYDYLDDDCWDLVKQYIDRGGNFIYTHDDANLEGTYAARGIGNILGRSVGLVRNVESYAVFKFTDTPSGLTDYEIFNGPFGDPSPYHWGQDRIGTSYVTGNLGPDVIIYSNHAQNKNAPSNPGASLFRHKTKGFFFAGDGGFYLNEKLTAVTSTTEDPFRIDPSTKFPILASYGSSATSGSPAAGTPAGGFQIANSMMFGNIISWMLNRAHYHGINRN